MEPLGIDYLNDLGDSKEYCKKLCIEHVNDVIRESAAELKYNGSVSQNLGKSFPTYFSVFLDVAKMYYKKGLAVFTYVHDTNDKSLRVHTNLDLLIQERFKIDYDKLIGTFFKEKVFEKTCDDWLLSRERIENHMAISGLTYNEKLYIAFDIGEKNFKIKELEKKTTRKRFNFFG